MRRIVLLAAVVGFLLGPAVVEPAGATTPTTVSATAYRSALTTRLAHEWGSRPLASSVVRGLSPGTVALLQQKVPADDVATSSFLDYTPPRVTASKVDSIVAFAFGWRNGPGGTQLPGPVNKALAARTAAFVTAHPHVHVYAQTGISQVLTADGVKHVVSLTPAPGQTYIDTLDVAKEAATKAKAAGVPLGTVGVIAFSDHAARAVGAARKAGMKAGVPSGVSLPSTYDTQSGQATTRSRVAYLPGDLLGRLLGD